MIRDHIAANLGIEKDDAQDVLVSREARTPEATDVQDVLVSRETGMSGATDFDYAPFSQQGGLGKVFQLFGDELNVIIEELNEALAA